MEEEAKPHGVSVIVPTFNRPEVLLDTIQDLLAQHAEDWELIIVDQSDKINDAALILLKSSTISSRYYHAQFRGLPQARNFGWRAAHKDIVLYVDDDIRCGPDLVGEHLLAHQSSGAALVAGGIDEARGNHTMHGNTGAFNWWTAESIRNFHFTQAGPCLQAPGGNFSVKKCAMQDVGGLDEYLTIGAALYEETELALRLRQAGFKGWFAPAARLLHLAAPAGGCRVLNDWPRYMHGMAHNRAILIFRHLRWWHRPTALLRLLQLGLSYSRLDRSFRPFLATLRGLKAGHLHAGLKPLNAELHAVECTTS